MLRFRRQVHSGRGIVSQFLLPLSVAVFFQLGCGAGCSCARRNSEAVGADTETEMPVSLESEKRQAGTKSVDTDVDLVSVGRDVELGRYDEALAKLDGIVLLSDKTRYLGALAEFAKKNYTGVVSLLSADIRYSHSDLRFRAKKLLINALEELGRCDEVITIVAELIEPPGLAKSEQRDLLEKRGDCQLVVGEYDGAYASFDMAKKLAGPDRSDSLRVKMGRALIGDEHPDEAVEILAPLALHSNRKKILKDAYTLLHENGLLPRWSTSEKMTRIEQLAASKSWDDALLAMSDLEKETASSEVKNELRWQKARVLFSRRNHYAEAMEILLKVARDGGSHSDDAAFMSARALARMDRDEAAIVAFRGYAGKTANDRRAAEARFQAARLEYYLGKHKQALRNFQALVGDGKHRRRNRLTGGTERDALFLAGMSAFLLKRYSEAGEFFDAASVGSGSREAVVRNRYWSAVSLLMIDKDRGANALRELCRSDSTSWYALFAGIRLHDAGLTTDGCAMVLPDTVSGDAKARKEIGKRRTGTGTKPGVDTGQGTEESGKKSGKYTSETEGELSQKLENSFPKKTPEMPLAQISSRAALFASMGLFRPAAEALYAVDKAKKSPASRADFILHYQQLDAPQYAIRNASAGLDWENTDTSDQWLAYVAYPTPYASLVMEQETRHSLPPYLIYAIARKESLFDPHAVSYAGAMGMMQMMPTTYEANRKRAGLPELGVGALPTPAESIIAGGFELAQLLEQFEGNIPLVIMAYNGGARAVKRWLSRSGEFSTDVFVEKAGFAQTRNYVRRVYQNFVRYSQLYHSPPPPLPRHVRMERK